MRLLYVLILFLILLNNEYTVGQIPWDKIAFPKETVTTFDSLHVKVATSVDDTFTAINDEPIVAASGLGHQWVSHQP